MSETANEVEVTERLKRFEESAKALFEHNPDMVWWIDVRGTIVSVNSNTEKLTGFLKREIVKSTFNRCFAEGESDRLLSRFVLAKMGKPQNFEAAFIHKAGYELHLNVTFVPVTVDFKIVGVYGIAKDVTEQKKMEAALIQSHCQITNILESITDGFLAIGPEWRITYWNREAERATGRKKEEMIGKVLWDELPELVGTAVYKKFHKALIENSTVQFEYYDQAVNKWYSFHIYPSNDGLSIYFHDISESMLAEQKISRMTYYDALTGLPNQKLFRQRLQQAVVRPNCENQLSVMVIDLDRFKSINESLGYESGDRLILSVSRRLKACLQDTDIVSRYEGDSFAILLTKANRVRVERIAERILEEFQKPYELEGQQFVVTPSVGIALFPSAGTDGGMLLTNACIAMRRVKEAGKNAYRFYTEGMNTRPAFKLQMELRKAIDHGELIVFYQPQIHLQTGKISAIEALVRWKHPELGMVPPAEFIPIAEETGLILPLGEWVLRTACTQNAAWQQAGYDPFVVSVNLSPRQFAQRNFVGTVKDILKETGLHPQYLELEITESTMMDVESTLVILNDLKQLGVRISIDDFGKGYSSLAYLKRFPLNTLKIDQAFVQDCTEDENDATLIKTIIFMAHHLNLNVIAEGVETKEQLIFLQQHLCNGAQGYFFSKPVAAQDLEQQFHEIQHMVDELGLGKESIERMRMEEQLHPAGI